MPHEIAPINGPILRSQNLVLRPVAGRDYDGFHALLASERGKFVGGPLDDEGRIWRAFASLLGHWHIKGYGVFAITRPDNDTCMGITGNWFPNGNPETEIGWSIWQDYEGKSIAFEAAETVIKHSFATLKMETVVSYIDKDNTRSQALAHRLGAVIDDDAERPDQRDIVFRHPTPLL